MSESKFEHFFIFCTFFGQLWGLYLAKYGSYVRSDDRYDFIRWYRANLDNLKFFDFQPTFRAYISWDKGRISVPMADVALSDVIEQIWAISNFSNFWPFLVNFQGPDFGSDCTYGFADSSCMTSGLTFKIQTIEYMGDLGLTFHGHFRSSGMFSNWSSYMTSSKCLIVTITVSSSIFKICPIEHIHDLGMTF